MGKAQAKSKKTTGPRSLKQREGPAENRRHRNAVRAEQDFGKKTASSRKSAKKAGGKGKKQERQARPASGVSAAGQKAAPLPRSGDDLSQVDSRGRFQAGPAIAPEGNWHASAPIMGLAPAEPANAHEPLIAIVGRPNVGKSTLFNRMTGSRRSIVGDEPGITRDRIYGEVTWNGRTARVVDTGGIVPDDDALIPSEIFRQARVALDQASALVLVVDVRTELASPDMELARLLQRMGTPLFLAVNKVDSPQLEAAAENFRTLGIGNLVSISAEHSNGVAELLDEIFAALPAPVETEETTEAAGAGDATPEDGDGDTGSETDGDGIPERERKFRVHGEFRQAETNVAIIGRPNVGKSTLLNALTGSDRAIVSPIAGTTRDAVDEVATFDGHPYRFVDTAGIRRKGKTTLMAEKLSVIMARKHLEAADVAILLIDAVEGVTATDATIGGYAHESGRSVVIAINKWDLVGTARTDGKPPADMELYLERVRESLKYLSYAPVIFLSAQLAGEGDRGAVRNAERLMREVAHVAVERRKRVTTGQMNRFLAKLDFQRAPVPLSKRMRIFFVTQAAVAPPTFVLFTDRDVKLHFAFERFLENQLRGAFGFAGTPIWFKVRPRAEKKAEK